MGGTFDAEFFTRDKDDKHKNRDKKSVKDTLNELFTSHNSLNTDVL